jgi:AbrB family looped-hinge helix DNA binding protein
MNSLSIREKEELVMPVVKVMDRRQVVIPKEIFEELKLKTGDYLEAMIDNGKIVYIPKQLVDRDAWYWSEEGQQRINESLDDLKKGRVTGPFTNAKDLVKSLRKHKS